MNIRLIKFRHNSGAVTAIAGEPGRIYTPLVWIDAPLRVHKVPNGDLARYGRELPNAKSLKRAANRMLRAGKALGITKAAKKFLREAKA